jgi:hypothetical protein
VTSSPDPQSSGRRLRPAIVLGSTEDACTILTEGQVDVVPYAAPFPRPRAVRVAPGQLVAVATSPTGQDVVVWRWFDAVVIDLSPKGVTVWEPNHGFVVAQARDPLRTTPLGSRAYLSAGLPGADWWLAGPTVARAEDADVEITEVEAFFTGHGLWDHLT